MLHLRRIRRRSELSTFPTLWASRPGADIYLSSAAPAQKVSGASIIEEFNHGKVIFLLLLEVQEPQFRGQAERGTIPDGK